MLTTTTATNLFARSNVIVCSFVALVYHTVGGGETPIGERSVFTSWLIEACDLGLMVVAYERVSCIFHLF